MVQSHTHYIYILYGELESQTGGAPGLDIQGWGVRVEGSGGHRPAPARAAPPVTIRLGVMRLGVIKLGVKPLDNGGGCIWVISASSLDSLEINKTHLQRCSRKVTVTRHVYKLRGGHTYLSTFSVSRSSLTAMSLSSLWRARSSPRSSSVMHLGRQKNLLSCTFNRQTCGAPAVGETHSLSAGLGRCVVRELEKKQWCWRH